MMRISKVARVLPLSVLTLLLWCTGGASPASAQTVAVSSASPSSAALGTVNLDVTINGNGFKNGASAQWFVTGTTNPGGVTVNSTRFVSGSQLKANITVAQNAVLSNFDIVVKNTNGRTGKGTELFAVTPAYNPQIVYHVNSKAGSVFTITVSNADGTDVVPLYSTPAKTIIGGMKFAPTGNRVVFNEYTSATNSVIKVLTYSVSAQGVTTTSVNTLSTEPYKVLHLDVSPDGTELLFVEDTADPNVSAVYVMSMAGGPRTQIALSPYIYSDAVWAHSNSRIAVLYGSSWDQSAGLLETIQIVDVDPTNGYSIVNLNTVLTNNVSQLYQILRLESAHTTDSLLFTATPTGAQSSVYKVDIGTQSVTPIVTGRQASFSANDSMILFQGYNGTGDLFTLDLTTNAVTQLTSKVVFGAPDFLP
jgi:hypothetical protein